MPPSSISSLSQSDDEFRAQLQRHARSPPSRPHRANNHNNINGGRANTAQRAAAFRRGGPAAGRGHGRLPHSHPDVSDDSDAPMFERPPIPSAAAAVLRRQQTSTSSSSHDDGGSSSDSDSTSSSSGGDPVSRRVARAAAEHADPRLASLLRDSPFTQALLHFRAAPIVPRAGQLWCEASRRYQPLVSARLLGARTLVFVPAGGYFAELGAIDSRDFAIRLAERAPRHPPVMVEQHAGGVAACNGTPSSSFSRSHRVNLVERRASRAYGFSRHVDLLPAAYHKVVATSLPAGTAATVPTARGQRHFLCTWSPRESATVTGGPYRRWDESQSSTATLLSAASSLMAHFSGPDSEPKVRAVDSLCEITASAPHPGGGLLYGTSASRASLLGSVVPSRRGRSAIIDSDENDSPGGGHVDVFMPGLGSVVCIAPWRHFFAAQFEGAGTLLAVHDPTQQGSGFKIPTVYATALAEPEAGSPLPSAHCILVGRRTGAIGFVDVRSAGSINTTMSGGAPPAIPGRPLTFIGKAGTRVAQILPVSDTALLVRSIDGAVAIYDVRGGRNGFTRAWKAAAPPVSVVTPPVPHGYIAVSGEEGNAIAYSSRRHGRCFAMCSGFGEIAGYRASDGELVARATAPGITLEAQIAPTAALAWQPSRASSWSALDDGGPDATASLSPWDAVGGKSTLAPLPSGLVALNRGTLVWLSLDAPCAADY